MPRSRASPAEPRRHLLDRRAAQLLTAEPPGIGHNRPPDTPPAAHDDVLLTTQQVASWLLLSVQWCELGRVKGYGPKFVVLGPRCVRYRVGDVRDYLRERVHACTSEYRNSAAAPHVGRRRTRRRRAPR